LKHIHLTEKTIIQQWQVYKETEITKQQWKKKNFLSFFPLVIAYVLLKQIQQIIIIIIILSVIIYPILILLMICIHIYIYIYTLVLYSTISINNSQGQFISFEIHQQSRLSNDITSLASRIVSLFWTAYICKSFDWNIRSICNYLCRRWQDFVSKDFDS